MVRGFLRHLAARDARTEVPPPGLLGPQGHRKPPHIYSDEEITALLQAAGTLAPAAKLRGCCYATLFGLLACTGLRISEALAMTCGDVDLPAAMLTVTGKRGRTHLVPLHPSAVEPLSAYDDARRGHYGPPAGSEAFFRTDESGRVSYSAAHGTFVMLRRQLGGPRAGVAARPVFMTCATGWWCGESRPGMLLASTWTPRSARWRLTSATWKCAACTGTCPPCRS